MYESRYKPERFDPREGLSYGEWLDRRDQKAMQDLVGRMGSGYQEVGQMITRMAGIEYKAEISDQKVEEAMAILREQNPLGGPWISLAQDYRRMRQAEAVLGR